MKKQGIVLLAVFCGALWSGAMPAFADKLGDFKKAEKAAGCGLIPYSSLQSKCNNAQQRVTRWCKSKPIACQPSQRKPELRERLDNGRQCVASRKEVAAIFAETKSKLRGETKPVKEIADRLVRSVEAGESGHAQAVREYETAVRNCEKCLK
ncbi:MAG: hypothetical protein WCU88_07100 [Elusimicrobiota bacterium]|jgi:hypothetical protein